MLDFLFEISGIANVLEPLLILNDLLDNYCETPERLTFIVDLLKRLPEFATENLKLSNCLIRGQLPYDSLIGLTKEDLSELLGVMYYLGFPENLTEKLIPVIDNMTAYDKYKINGKHFDPKDTSNWSVIGDLEGLKYAHYVDNCPWNTWTCSYAARNGHLECLKYAHEHGCPWDEDTCACAAMNGHLECLKYARQHGCPE